MIPRRARFAVLAAAAALLLAACSLARVAYENAGPAATWLVADYVELSPAQKEWVRGRIDHALAWHRREELPEYRRFLESMLRLAQGPVSVAEAAAAHQRLRGYYERMVERLLPDAAQLLAQLDGEQVAGMEARFAESNRKYAREWLAGSPESRRRREISRMIEQLEKWTGSLDLAQRELVARHVGALPSVAEARMADRRYRQEQTLALVRARPSPEAMQQGLRRLLLQTQAWRPASLTAAQRERDRGLHAMIAELSATLSQEQRAELRGRLRGYIGDISQLTAAR